MNTSKNVSVLENCHSDKVIGETTIANWLKPDQHKDQVLNYRSAASAKEKDKILKKLPAITPAATFEECRDDEKIKDYTDLIYVTIPEENLKNFKDLELAKFRLAGCMPEVAYCGLSLSGKGLDVLIHVEATQFFYLHGEELVRVLFAARMDGLSVVCHSLTDTMVASYDPNPFINPDAGKMTLGHTFEAQKHQYRTSLEGLIKQIKENRMRLSAEQENVLRMEIAHIYGEDGRTLFNDFVNRNSNDDLSDSDDLYDEYLDAAENVAVEMRF